MSSPDFPLLLASGPLLLVAGWDIAKRRIPNWANAALACTALVLQGLYNGGGAVLSGLGAALVTLALLWGPWTKGRLGGGDVKATLCAAMFLGFGLLVQFYLYTAIAAGIAALVCLGASSARVRREIAENMKLVALRAGMPDAPMRSGGGRVSVPFGPAAAAAALVLLWWK
jgi:leader peptidase (prepilin peptidase)/N-methyltransferase